MARRFQVLTYTYLVLLASAPLTAGAFPEMIRHGYTQCTACHFSPSGGGILTPYGRQLSAELMSRWSFPGEGLLLHGAVGDVATAKGVHLGGDFRFTQIHRENALEKRGQLFIMQSQLELAYQKQNVVFAFTLGEVERPMDHPFRANLYSPGYYGQVFLTDEWSFRAGRFNPNFGLKFPDHTLATRQYMGFAPNLKWDTIETNYLGEQWTLSAGATQTTNDIPESQKRRARTGTIAYAFADRFKVGISYWQGQKSTADQNMQSAFALLGWTHRLFTAIEIDRLETDHNVDAVALTRLGYEIARGLVPYLQIQSIAAGAKNLSSRSYLYSGGFQFFPRSHFELSGQWTRVNTPKNSSDQAYLIFHYYL